MPMVLVVGSHEPRKNHRAVLHAAELLWREGLNFSLLFVGGNSWNSERFTRALHDLQAAGRPVHAVRALTDDLLRAAYTIAYCTLFPSFNEGFGLPVAESIASGTPVITSNFGSMREIAEPGGALLVDPRDDHDIARALRKLLTDDALRASLARETRARPERTWEDYAEQSWDYLVHGTPPRT
jgi:glycosyltransferase involved in cell wall biosynthesis